jgi:hypothetical protein
MTDDEIAAEARAGALRINVAVLRERLSGIVRQLDHLAADLAEWEVDRLLDTLKPAGPTERPAEGA